MGVEKYPQPTIASLKMVADLLAHAIRLGIPRRKLTQTIGLNVKSDHRREIILQGRFSPTDIFGERIALAIEQYRDTPTPNGSRMTPMPQHDVSARDLWIAWHFEHIDMLPSSIDRMTVGVALEMLEIGMEDTELAREEIATWLGLPRGEFDRACAGLGDQLQYRYRAQELIRKARELKTERSK